jgi:hypothetical protein
MARAAITHAAIKVNHDSTAKTPGQALARYIDPKIAANAHLQA